MSSPFTFFRSPITLRQFSTGSYSNGLWVEGSATDSTILASIQPLEGEEMDSLPEGRRESESYKMYTSTKVKTVQEAGSKQNADQIIFNNKEFEIHQVNPWQNNSNFNVVNHYKYLILRINNG